MRIPIIAINKCHLFAKMAFIIYNLFTLFNDYFFFYAFFYSSFFSGASLTIALVVSNNPAILDAF